MGTVMASKRCAPATDTTEELPKAVNVFGVHLYQTIKESRDGENMFFSPLSISTAMGMTQLGARGDTAKQIAEVFRFNNIAGDQLHQTFKKLDNALFNPDQEKDQESRMSYRPPGYRFLVSANKLYGKSGFPFEQSFLDNTARFYDLWHRKRWMTSPLLQPSSPSMTGSLSVLRGKLTTSSIPACLIVTHGFSW